MHIVLGPIVLEGEGPDPVAFYALLAVAFVSLAVCCRRRSSISPAVALGVAALLRLVLVPLPPTLSNDVYRYLWDGKMVAAGLNPYAFAPEAPELLMLRDEGWELLSHRDVETVYPPFAMSLFSIAAWLPQSLLVYKLLLISLDLAGCALLLRLAAQRGVPAPWTLWYVWNPLAVLEGAGMGHIDVVGVSAAIATLYLLHSAHAARTTAPALTAAAGVLSKLVPLVALPMWARQSGRAPRFLALALLFVLLPCLPILWSTGGIPPGLVRYAVSWEFNGPLFEPLWRALGVLQADEAIKEALTGLKGLTGWHELWNRFYPYVYPQFLAKLLLALGLGVVVVLSWWWRDPLPGARRLFGAVLLLSATLYPWYYLWVLPWAALTASRPWILLSATLPLAYLPQLAGVAYFPWVYLSIWAPFAAALLFERWSTG